MTLANCERLLKHYEDSKNVEAAADMRKNIAAKKASLGVKDPKK